MESSETQQEVARIAAEQTVNAVFEILADGGATTYIGEKISQLEHSLQTAAQAKEAAADDATVLAALLHDIGQFGMFPEFQQQQIVVPTSVLAELDASDSVGARSRETVVGIKDHERIGAEYLRRMGFSEKVAQLVEAHVDVKRYLTGKDRAYYELLSTTSKLSLRQQGGSFTPDQCAAFELDPLCALKIQVRRWDDGAKLVGWHAPGLETYRAMAIAHVMEEKLSRP